MKKLILLVGIFVSSLSFGQLTGTQEEINKKAEIVAERAYNLLTEDLLSNRDEFEKYLTTLDNEYNIDKDGVFIKVSLGYCISNNVVDGDYNDYIKVINSDKFMPLHDRSTNYEIKYVDGPGGYYLIIEITDEEYIDEHSIIVGFFDDLSIKSLFVIGYTNKYPLVYRDNGELLYTSVQN
jgi:hypothetical protein